ncbi:glycosyltransferase [Flavobacterium sp.]|uniref:glycosyltransferase n=1 Tax=Flavobacterium sp. TaxID=239 RepID=UPI003BBDAA74
MTTNNLPTNILVAPLNWGLGHAARCIIIIKELEKNGFNPIIASDGPSLLLLKKEFPHLTSLELPSYCIEYPKNSRYFIWKLLFNSPKIAKAVRLEKKLVSKWVKEYSIGGIISDNRFGIYNESVPSVYITHQLKVLSGNTTWFSSKIHTYYIRKFNECWVPDVIGKINLSGELGHLNKTDLTIKYIGVLSRMNKKIVPIKYNLMVLLSGPEPQRTFLEEKLTEKLQNYKDKVVFIKGKIEAKQKIEQIGNVTFYNYMQTEQLEATFNESEMVLCRSGYTTIMDLTKLEKKAYFIPTPGQFEQEYLASKCKFEGYIPSIKQSRFKLEHLSRMHLFNGLPKINSKTNWTELFDLFQSK